MPSLNSYPLCVFARCLQLANLLAQPGYDLILGLVHELTLLGWGNNDRAEARQT